VIRRSPTRRGPRTTATGPVTMRCTRLRPGTAPCDGSPFVADQMPGSAMLTRVGWLSRV